MTLPDPTSPAERREPLVHDLKTWPKPFAAVRAGLKPWELRLNDRDHQVGDTLRLREWSPAIPDDYPNPGFYTGQVEERLVTWMLDGGRFGLPKGYVIMSLAPPPEGSGLDLDGMEKVAKVATPGPWTIVKQVSANEKVVARGHGRHRYRDLTVCLTVSRYALEGAAINAANTAHIATFDPPTVLKLISLARRAGDQP